MSSKGEISRRVERAFQLSRGEFLSFASGRRDDSKRVESLEDFEESREP